MANHHNDTLINAASDLESYFRHPPTQRQRQYEAVRAVVMEKRSIAQIAEAFGYQASTVYSLIRDARAGKKELFPEPPKGPQSRRVSKTICDKVISLRRKYLSTEDIRDQLKREGINISASTSERILKDAGFLKLKRRTNKELGKTRKNKIIPERSAHLDFDELEPFNIDCPSAGVFFFIPYLLESGVLETIKGCQLPDSSEIGATQACLSMLALKILGCKRLSHIGAYDQEPGLGIFAGLNILPKPTYMNTYSCRCAESQLMTFQNKVIESFKKRYPHFYKSEFMNLDFHSIPHYGDESQMQKLWCGAKHQNLKGANTIFAQDSQSNAIVYTRADILRKEESSEVKKFVKYWKKINGNINETLVFDCKFTTYKVLEDLCDDQVKFITLRKRSAKLIEGALSIPEKNWKKIYLPIPKRKHKSVSVREQEVKLHKKSDKVFRQITVKDHGRALPTFILTNNRDLPLEKTLIVYAKRWHVENKLSELITFFNLNALSSSLMIRIHFDILWTMIADTLYHIFAQDLRRFERHLAPSLFKKFIDMPGRIVYDGHTFFIKIRKRAHTPILRDVKKLNSPFSVPWLQNKNIEIVWTA